MLKVIYLHYTKHIKKVFIMLSTNEITSLLKKYDFSYSQNEVSEELRMKSTFINTLLNKISENPTIEKKFFLNLFLSYVLMEDIDFSYSDKKKFLWNFIFEKRNSVQYFKKAYDYVSPVSMSLYCPEFYETINEVLVGEDVPLPTFKEKSSSSFFDGKEEDFDGLKDFFKVLTELEQDLAKDENNAIPSLLLIKWLKTNPYIVSGKFYDFYSSFRKLDVLQNDNVSLVLTDLKDPLKKHHITSSKDMNVCNMLNSGHFIRMKAIEKYVKVSPLVFEKINSFFFQKIVGDNEF